MRNPLSYALLVMTMLNRFLRDAGGATSIEYALIAGIVSICAVVALKSMGSSLKLKLVPIGNALN